MRRPFTTPLHQALLVGASGFFISFEDDSYEDKIISLRDETLPSNSKKPDRFLAEEHSIKKVRK